MKKPIVVFAAIFSLHAFAFDLQAIEESRSTLIAALNGVIKESTGTAQYIPDYGLHIATRELFEPSRKESVLRDLPNLVEGLASSIDGLDKGDWVSVSYRNDTPKYEILARTKPGQTNTLEVWVNGVRR